MGARRSSPDVAAAAVLAAHDRAAEQAPCRLHRLVAAEDALLIRPWQKQLLRHRELCA